MLSPNCVS